MGHEGVLKWRSAKTFTKLQLLLGALNLNWQDVALRFRFPTSTGKQCA